MKFFRPPVHVHIHLHESSVGPRSAGANQPLATSFHSPSRSRPPSISYLLSANNNVRAEGLRGCASTQPQIPGGDPAKARGGCSGAIARVRKHPNPSPRRGSRKGQGRVFGGHCAGAQAPKPQSPEGIPQKSGGCRGINRTRFGFVFVIQEDGICGRRESNPRRGDFLPLLPLMLSYNTFFHR